MRTVLAAALAVAAVVAAGTPSFADQPTRPPKPTHNNQQAAAGGAEMLTKLSPEAVGQALDAVGLHHTQTTDSGGDPLIEVDLKAAGLPGEEFKVLFYTCEAAGCEDITLWSWYHKSPTVPLDVINGWNRDKRWTKAYLDNDKDVNLEYDINATGGIGREALGILVATYVDQMKKFAEAIGYP